MGIARRGVVVAVLGLLAVVGCVGQEPALTGAGEAWPAADELFCSDERWLGSDGAFSVDLGDGRVLWLFGDTLVAPEGERSRDEAFFVSNTVAVQRGYDPANASIDFHWRTSEEEEGPLPEDPLSEEGGEPRAVFPDEGSIAHWPQDAVVIGDELLVFAHRVDRGDGGQFGFEGRGWTAFLVENPGTDPASWRVDELSTPPSPANVSLGTSVFVHEGHLYVYGVHTRQEEDGWTHHDPVLVRWPLDSVPADPMPEPSWWQPDRETWTPGEELGSVPRALFEPGAPSFTVFRHEAGGTWGQVQATGFGQTPLDLRTSSGPTGAWSASTTLYDPPEGEDEDVMTYAGLAHPHLEGSDLVMTYSTNTEPGEEAAEDDEAYYPRFVRVDLEER